LLDDSWGGVNRIAVVGTLAYVTTGVSGLRIVSIADPTHPVELGHYDTPGDAVGVAVQGNYAYVADWDGGLRVVDITNPSTPEEAGFCCYSPPEPAENVAVSGNHAYVAKDEWGLWVVDITNPAAPIEVGYYFAWTKGVAVSGNYAYLAVVNGGLAVLDITNPAVPVQVGGYATPGNPHGVAVSGTYAYLAAWRAGLRVVNILNPAAPSEVGSYDTPGHARGVTVSGNYAYVADELSGLRVVNITNPAAPFETGFYDTPGEAYGVAVSGNCAYVADTWHGLRIYDCSAAMGDPCVADLTVTLDPDNPNFPGSQNVSACARIVPYLPTRIVVPVSNSTNVPTVIVTAGCASEPGCEPAEGWNLALPWQYDANTTSFFTTIMRVGTGCCVTLNLDYILPVELLSFSAVPGDAQVLLRWQTASETGSDRFEIERDGMLVHHTPAAGDATGHSYSWIDRDLTNGQTYHYSLWSVEMNGERSLLRETDATPMQGIVTVTKYALHGNYPNPFNPVTEIAYDLPEAGTVSLKVFDLMGREVAVLVDGEKPAGQHTIRFDARDLPSGVYVCRMTANEFTASHKMMLIR
jgi:hypothetical protein